MSSDKEKNQNVAVIGIGSNINAEENIPRMLEIMHVELTVVKVSSFVKTKPIGVEDQSDYTNGAVKITTSLNMDELNHLLKHIENQLGRERSQGKYSSRTIDLDIVVWNGEVVDKDFYTRDFLRKSVSEVISF
jgi:2-amino-4-hydroxy-6-hydroxymethyldihydropteridine diphosphokinase